MKLCVPRMRFMCPLVPVGRYIVNSNPVHSKSATSRLSVDRELGAGSYVNDIANMKDTTRASRTVERSVKTENRPSNSVDKR